MNNKTITLLIIALLVIILPIIFVEVVEIDNEKEIMAFGFELEQLLSFINGVIALILFLIAFIAYRKDGRKRVLYVSTAFLLFSIKSFLMSSENFIIETEFLEPIAIILEFLVLLVFFFGVFNKES